MAPCPDGISVCRNVKRVPPMPTLGTPRVDIAAASNRSSSRLAASSSPKSAERQVWTSRPGVSSSVTPSM